MKNSSVFLSQVSPRSDRRGENRGAIYRPGMAASPPAFAKLLEIMVIPPRS